MTEATATAYSSGTPIFIAVDFGTTYSGVAFAVGKDGPRAREIIVQPDIDDGKKERTFLLLNASDNSLHSFGKAAWQEFVELDEEDEGKYLAFDLFKMELQHDKNVTGDMKIKAKDSDKRLPARIVFGRSLEYFYKNIKNRLVLSLFGVDKAERWEDIKDDVKWIITVPAMWKARARQFMKEAAIEAGMATRATQDRILIGLEPEGAALACRDDLMRVSGMLGDPKELCYMVVDCGGGTVDVVIHKMDRNTKTIREVHPPSGDNWGGTTVDNEVKEFVKKVIGKDIVEKLTDTHWLEFTEKLSEAKQDTSLPNGTQDIRLNLPSAFHETIRENGGNLDELTKPIEGLSFRKKHCLLVFKEEMFRTFFDNSLREISDHIHGLLQIYSKVACILVVGGYAESPYLYNHLNSQFGSPTRFVTRPTNAGLSTLKGAVMYGQDPSVIQSRISDRSYGIACYQNFDPTKHPESKKIKIAGVEMCKDVYSEFVKVGQEMKSGEPAMKRFGPVEPTDTRIGVYIFCLEKAVEYTTGLTPLATMAIPMLHPEKGLDRKMLVEMDLSGTQLQVTAYDRDGGTPQTVKMEFEWMYPG